jgi:hypothetical protein
VDVWLRIVGSDDEGARYAKNEAGRKRKREELDRVRY